MRNLHCCLAVASLIGAVVAAWAAAPARSADDELKEDHELSLEFETPHTDWARPYALGTVRVLYFGWGSYDRGIEARDIVELMQRFDIAATAAYRHRIIDSPRIEWHGAEAGLERIRRLLDQPWDCFMFAGVAVTDLPHELQYKMYEAVTEGAGIVLLGVDDERALKPQNRVTPTPPFLVEADEPIGEAFRIKAGRGIRLPQRPQIPYHPGWETGYDYWLERVGRAVLWAANKAPRVELAVTPDAARFDRAHAPGRLASVKWSGGSAGEGLTLDARLRKDDGRVFGLPRPRPLSSGEGSTILQLEYPLPAGHYHLDVTARNADSIEAWATAPIEITSPRTVEAVELARDWGEIGDRIAGTAKLVGPATAGEKVWVQLVDARGRVLVQADRPVSDSTARFEFAIEDWMPMLLEVRARLTDGDQEVSSAYSYFRVTKRNRGQFNFVVWDWPADTIAPYAEQQLARLGCTVQLRGGAPSLILGASNISQVPYTTRIMTSWDDNGYMLPTCWNNEPAVDQWVDSIVSQYERSREHGVFVYSLGDETATTGACVHPACLAAYRRYLQQEYGDIAALNQSWGSAYAGFDEVQLLAAGDNDEAEALRAKIYPRWYDRQAFKGYNFVKLCERFGRRFKQLDPQALTGFEGAGGFADGTDMDLICRTNGFWSPYPGLADEVLRSIAPRELIRSNWMGYTKDADSLLEKYWRMVTRGCDSVWWWHWTGFGTYRGLLAPHLAPWRAIEEMQRDTQIVRDGLGDLLLKSTREDDGIAILYSYPSTFAAQLEAGPSYGKYEDDHAAWHRTLRALGLQFSYVTDRMLRLGEFRAQRYKVLILPQTEAIGAREAEVIRDFVMGGGTVIADVRPGLYDHHCKPLARGPLDDLFGIERTGNREAVSAEGAIHGAPPDDRRAAKRLGLKAAVAVAEPPSHPGPPWRSSDLATSLGDRALAVSLARVQVDPAVRAAKPTAAVAVAGDLATSGGQAMGSAGDAPLCIINQAGRGRAVLLNFTMSSFPDISDAGAPPAAADFAAALLASAGVTPTVTVTDAAGRPVRDTEVIRWKGSGVDFLALFGGKDETVRVTLPRARHVYDLRERAYRGLRDTFAVHKLPMRATFVALSPVALSAPQTTLSANRIDRGERLTVRLSYAPSRARHAVRLCVYGPDGRHAEWFDRVVVVDPPGAEATLPIAYNDRTGVWTIRATDLYTNEAAQARFAVQ